MAVDPKAWYTQLPLSGSYDNPSARRMFACLYIQETQDNITAKPE